MRKMNDRVASNIVEYRETLKRMSKRFEHVSKLKKVNQIGPVTYDRIHTYFFVKPVADQ